MTEKRFTLSKDIEWWFVGDNTIKVNEFGYREDLTDEDKYRGLQQDLTEQEVVDLLNELYEENQKLKSLLQSERRELIEQNNNYRKHLCELKEENKKLKLQNEELLYQIGYVGKNNKTCRECECFIPEIKYCYMWDMEVEADDVVVACNKRNVKKINEMMDND